MNLIKTRIFFFNKKS